MNLCTPYLLPRITGSRASGICYVEVVSGGPPRENMKLWMSQTGFVSHMWIDFPEDGKRLTLIYKGKDLRSRLEPDFE
jgi:hypothetical protein